MRKKIVAGNWKMNKTLNEAQLLLSELKNINTTKVDVITCVPFPFLHLDKNPMIKKGAQNVSEYINGAHTGEVSAEMLQSMGVEYCIVGHSERRKYFHEGDNALLEKLIRLLENNITPIFCIGEQLEEREHEKHFEVIKHQLEVAFRLNEDDFKKLVIAYEPVWAIGTGKTATNEQAEEIHAFIRNEIKIHFNENTAQSTSILYGGSCNAKNAAGLFSMPNIDGGLIGGASLNAPDFIAIINAAN